MQAVSLAAANATGAAQPVAVTLLGSGAVANVGDPTWAGAAAGVLSHRRLLQVRNRKARPNAGSMKRWHPIKR